MTTITEAEGNQILSDYLWGSNAKAVQSFKNNISLLSVIVERIEQGNYGVKMCRKVVEIYLDDTKQILIRTKEASRTESLWLALVLFLKKHFSNEKAFIHESKLRPCDCVDTVDTSKLSEQGISYNDEGLMVHPNHVILTLGNTTVKISMKRFKMFAEWYLTPQ